MPSRFQPQHSELISRCTFVMTLGKYNDGHCYRRTSVTEISLARHFLRKRLVLTYLTHHEGVLTP